MSNKKAKRVGQLEFYETSIQIQHPKIDFRPIIKPTCRISLFSLPLIFSSMQISLQENSGILTDIPTENKILGISRGISEDIPRKHKIWFPRNFLGIYRRNSEEISIRRNILMEYRGKMYSSEKTDEFQGYIIAVREPLESRWGILKIPRKFRRTSRWRRNSVGISSNQMSPTHEYAVALVSSLFYTERVSPIHITKVTKKSIFIHNINISYI
ncbi:hypothetical protein YC2023_059018 [Brassica napus]